MEWNGTAAGPLGTLTAAFTQVAYMQNRKAAYLGCMQLAGVSKYLQIITRFYKVMSHFLRYFGSFSSGDKDGSCSRGPVLLIESQI